MPVDKILCIIYFILHIPFSLSKLESGKLLSISILIFISLCAIEYLDLSAIIYTHCSARGSNTKPYDWSLARLLGRLSLSFQFVYRNYEMFECRFWVVKEALCSQDELDQSHVSHVFFSSPQLSFTTMSNV